MNKIKFSKDQIQKLALSTIGFVALVYVYFSFFLGPLNKSRVSMEKTMATLQEKLGSSKNDMAKAANLERQATTATTRYTALQALSPDGAPIAWFPPRMKVFFANQEIERATAKLDGSSGYKQKEMAQWNRFNWALELPQTDFVTASKAIAALENAEPLLAVSHLSIRAGTEEPQFQQITLSANIAIYKR